MSRLFPCTESVGDRAIESVLDTIRDEDAELPDWVLIESPTGEWRRFAAELPRSERRRSVVGATTERALLDALRLEIGGACRLPVSTPSLRAACASAESAVGVGRGVERATPGMVEMILVGATRLWGLGWRPFSFWDRLTGGVRLGRCLAEIARRLEIETVVLPGPVLLVADHRRADVERAAASTQVAVCPPGPPSLVDLTPALEADDPVDSVADVVREGVWIDPDPAARRHPVMELPSGRQVGSWTVDATSRGDGPGWTAAPILDRPVSGIWRLDRDEGTAELSEIESSSDLEGSDQPICRVMGRIGAGLRPGSPAALLLHAIALHDARAGRPLWVPSVGPEAVHFLLGLPGPIYVDGPGVPG
jgi:hypothetical protein